MTQLAKNPILDLDIAGGLEARKQFDRAPRHTKFTSDAIFFSKDPTEGKAETEREYLFSLRANYSSFTKNNVFDPATALPSSWGKTVWGKTHSRFDSMNQISCSEHHKVASYRPYMPKSRNIDQKFTGNTYFDVTGGRREVVTPRVPEHARRDSLSEVGDVVHGDWEETMEIQTPLKYRIRSPTGARLASTRNPNTKVPADTTLCERVKNRGDTVMPAIGTVWHLGRERSPSRECGVRNSGFQLLQQSVPSRESAVRPLTGWHTTREIRHGTRKGGQSWVGRTARISYVLHHKNVQSRGTDNHFAVAGGAVDVLDKCKNARTRARACRGAATHR